MHRQNQLNPEINPEINILLITSSPHRNGNSTLLGKACLNATHSNSQTNINIEEIYLPEFNLEYCRGCMQCLKQEDCIINDDLNFIKSRVVSADGIILSSPCYALLPNAIMLNFMQRIGMYNAYRSAFGGKYIVGISTAGGIGAKKVARFLSGFADGLFRDGKKVGALGVFLKWGDAKGSIAKAEHLGKKLIQVIKKKRKYRFQNPIGKILRWLFLKRIMIKNLEKNKDSEMSGVYHYVKTHQII